MWKPLAIAWTLFSVLNAQPTVLEEDSNAATGPPYLEARARIVNVAFNYLVESFVILGNTLRIRQLNRVLDPLRHRTNWQAVIDDLDSALLPVESTKLTNEIQRLAQLAGAELWIIPRSLKKPAYRAAYLLLYTSLSSACDAGLEDVFMACLDLVARCLVTIFQRLDGTMTPSSGSSLDSIDDSVVPELSPSTEHFLVVLGQAVSDLVDDLEQASKAN
jgi:hypothetical protein